MQKNTCFVSLNETLKVLKVTSYINQILESAENQYSGMQIGQLQDEEDEASNVLQDESVDPFRNPCLGMLNMGRTCAKVLSKVSLSGRSWRSL